MNTTSTRLFCVSLLTLCGCQPDSDLERWRGEHIDYLSSPSLEVCGESHHQMDDFVRFVASEVGITIPPGITYTWLDDLADAHCPEGSGGCARGTQAFSSTPMFPHELVHTVAGPHGINTWPFFAEGLAWAYDPWSGELFGDRYVLAPANVPLPDPRLSMTLPAAELYYPTAGSFVSFLLSRHGPAAYVAMTQRLPVERDLDVLRQIFRETYPTELDAEAELFLAGADCPADPYPTLVYDCVTPEVAWETPRKWHYHRDIDCADPDVTGGYTPSQAFRSVHSVTLDVPTTGTYTLQVRSPADITVQLGACFGCPWERRGTFTGEGEAFPLQLDAGPYFLRIVGWSDVPAYVEVDLFQP